MKAFNPYEPPHCTDNEDIDRLELAWTHTMFGMSLMVGLELFAYLTYDLFKQGVLLSNLEFVVTWIGIMSAFVVLYYFGMKGHDHGVNS